MRALVLAVAVGCAPSTAGPGGAPPAAADLAACMPRLEGTLATDTLNCGGCGPTPTGVDRRLGTVYRWHCCAGRPYDAQTDPLHCGTCATVCPEGTRCIDWTCQ